MNKLDINHRYIRGLRGVYIIWYDMNQRVIVRVGFGKIKEELEKNLKALEIQAFAKYNPKVTWAEISGSKYQKGVYKFLVEKLQPKIADEDPGDAASIEIDMPWN